MRTLDGKEKGYHVGYLENEDGIYKGDVKDGNRHGYGKWHPLKSSFHYYEGNFIEGIANGNGVANFSDSILSGIWKGGLLISGTKKFNTGELIEYYFDKNGNRFEKEFSCEGKFIEKKISKEGEILHICTYFPKGGKLILTKPDTLIIHPNEFDWKKREREKISQGSGEGELISEDGKLLHKGHFFRYSKQGKGTTFLNNCSISCDWMSDESFGSHLIKWNDNKTIYEGEVNKLFLPYGHGTVTYTDGCSFSGSFVNGKRNGGGTIISMITQQKLTSRWLDDIIILSFNFNLMGSGNATITGITSDLFSCKDHIECSLPIID